MGGMKRRWAALVCALACAVAPVLCAVDPSLGGTDGRQAWRTHDAHSQVIEIDLDTNADGRPDVQEYFSHGTLLRRDSDRNFDGRVDLIEEFDSVTRQKVRSIVDDDYDGIADRLLLFQNGAVVFSEHRSGRPIAAPAAPREHRMAGLFNPFSADTTWQSHLPVPASQPWVGVSTSVGLAETLVEVPATLGCQARPADSSRPVCGPDLTLRSPRGPPLA